MTSKSDVWSFGILLWELYSFGETPYRDIEIYQLKRHIQNGQTMEKPPYANDNMYASMNIIISKKKKIFQFILFFRYEIMQHCWRLNPESRPTFDSLEKWLYQLL